MLYHTGHINGFANLIAIDTALSHTIILLTNTNYRQLYISFQTIRRTLIGETRPTNWTLPPDASLLNDYAGTYFMEGMRVEIRPQYPDLTGSLAGQIYLLKKFLKDEFFFKDQEGLIRFNRDSAGNVISLSSLEDYKWVELKKIK